MSVMSLSATAFVAAVILLCACCLPADAAPDLTAHVDPDTFRNTSEIIADKGYPVQYYDITTADGFVLSAWRIPHGRNASANGTPRRGVVYLQHGYVSEAAIWVTGYDARQSIAYALADGGYEVWLVNSRQRPMPRHTTFPPTDPRSWAWGLAELARFDVAAALDFITKVAGVDRVTAYVGHSQGGSVGWIAFADPAIAAKVRVFIPLGGPARPPPPTSPSAAAAAAAAAAATPSLPPPHYATGAGGVVGSLACPECTAAGQPEWPGCCKGGLGLVEGNTWSPELCAALSSLCAEAVCVAVGCERHTNFNATRLPVFLGHWPTYTSAQDARDWPAFHVDRVQIPVAIYFGTHDHLCSPSVVHSFLPFVPKDKIVDVLELPWGHLEFAMADDAATLLWPRIFAVLDKFSNSAAGRAG